MQLNIYLLLLVGISYWGGPLDWNTLAMMLVVSIIVDTIFALWRRPTP